MIGTTEQLASRFAYLARLGAAGVYLSQARSASLPHELLGELPKLLDLARRQ